MDKSVSPSRVRGQDTAKALRNLGRAFAASQREAVLRGSDKLSMADIDREILAARKERKGRVKR